MAVRVTLTLLSLYRVLEFEGKPKLSTITDPGKDWSGLNSEVDRVIGSFWGVNPWANYSGTSFEAKPFSIAKSSGTSGGLASVDGGFYDENRVALVSHPERGYRLLDADGSTLAGYEIGISKAAAHAFCKERGLEMSRDVPSQRSTSLLGIVRAAYEWVSGPLHLFEDWCEQTGNDLLMDYLFQVTEDPRPFTGAPLGKLGMKHEAAGKVRVFAMVDAWTNWLLKPLHDMLFDHLKKIPQDGTFDQLGPIKRLQGLGKTKFWCYDLSAATDRLPVDLQVRLLAPYMGSLAETWKSLLVGRDYVLNAHGQKQSLRYAVGQPMGALSSWAMLALTHHLIVQWAALRAGVIPIYELSVVKSGGVGSKYWFSDYAVLGDDIVIANGRVAREYLLLMDQLGVGIGLEKSLVSRKGSLEFAKRYFLNGEDCSPVPFKELFAARGSISSLLQFGEKYYLKLSGLMSIMGWGYRAKSSVMSSFIKMSPRIRNLLLMANVPIVGEAGLSEFVELTSVRSSEQKQNWPAALWWYLAFQQNRLADALEAKQRDWITFAKAMGQSEADFTDEAGGLLLDWTQAQFQPQSPVSSRLDLISERTRSMISMWMYYDRAQEAHRELASLERDLTKIYEESMVLTFDPRDVFSFIELFHIRFFEIEERLDSLVLPPITEDRASSESAHWVRNPLLLVQVWKGMNAALRAPLDPGLAASLVNLHLWDDSVRPPLSKGSPLAMWYEKPKGLIRL
jgi:hypothetical protein